MIRATDIKHWRSAVPRTRRLYVATGLAYAFALGALTLGRVADVGAVDLDSIEDTTELCSTSDPELPDDISMRAMGSILEVSQLSLEYAQRRNERVMDVHRAEFGPGQFSLIPTNTLFSPDPVFVTLSGEAALPMFDGSYAVVLRDEAQTLTFYLPEVQQARFRDGTPNDVSLRLYFHLVSLDLPSQSYCVADEASVVQVRAMPLGAELIDASGEVAISAVETERLRDSQVRLGTELGESYVPARPRVLITDTQISTDDCPEGTEEFLRLEAESRLLHCYLEGLAENGRLQGAIVLNFAWSDHAGVVDEPHLDIDALNHEAVTDCARSAIQRIQFENVVGDFEADVRMTIIFRLE